jgi:hypothetical protein
MKELRNPINPEQKGDNVKATKTNQKRLLLLARELHGGQCSVDVQEITGEEEGQKAHASGRQRYCGNVGLRRGGGDLDNFSNLELWE